MKWNFEFVESQNFLRITVEGQFYLEEMTKLFEEIAVLEHWQSDTPIIFDNRLLEMKGVNLEVIRQSVLVMQKFSTENPGCRIAGLVNDGLNFGLGRQFEIITELQGSRGFRLFKDENLAFEWLLAK